MLKLTNRPITDRQLQIAALYVAEHIDKLPILLKDKDIFDTIRYGEKLERFDQYNRAVVVRLALAMGATIEDFTDTK